MKKTVDNILKDIQLNKELPLIFQNLETKAAIEKVENLQNQNQNINRNDLIYKKYNYYRPISKIIFHEK